MITAPPVHATHGAEPTSDMTQTERRVAYEIQSHINAERAARGLPTLAAYYDWTRAAGGAIAVVNSGSANTFNLQADLRWYGDRGMAALDIVNLYNAQHDTSGAVVHHLMSGEQRHRLLTARADVIAVGVACRAGRHAVTVHLIASTHDVSSAASPAQPLNPRVTSADAGTDCSDEGAHPSPPVGVDPRLAAPQGPVASARISGPSRIETALAISQRVFPDPAAVRTVVIATANDFPDALAVGPAGVMLGAPILLTWRDGLPASVIVELERLAPERIAVIGGTAAVDAQVFAQLGELAAVERWSGPHRIATAAAVAQQVWPNGTDTVYLAPADVHAPALAAAVPAGYGGHPLLLTWRDALALETADELARLAPARVVLAGGTGLLTGDVADAVADAAPGAEIVRLDADDPYALSALAAQDTPAGDETLFLATAERHPDALAAAPAVHAADGRLLLVPTAGAVPQIILDAAAAQCPTQVLVFGGAAAVHDAVVQAVVGRIAGAC